MVTDLVPLVLVMLCGNSLLSESSSTEDNKLKLLKITYMVAVFLIVAINAKDAKGDLFDNS